MKKNNSPHSVSDPGLGTAYQQEGGRVINKDGSLKIIRRGAGFSYRNLYHYLINMSWKKFLSLVLLTFLLINAVFAGLYCLIGMEGIQGWKAENPSSNYLQAFFFSTQTFTSVGYGLLAPSGISTNFLASFESLTGLLSVALMTGILYGRFSRPTARIIFSEKGVIAPYQEMEAFMLRIVNGRSNQMVDMKATLLLTFTENQNGQKRRVYRPLKLERAEITLFPLPWTIVHPIDEESPFSGMNQKQIMEAGFEVLALIQGYDDTFSQTVHARYSYKWDEIVWNARFSPMQQQREDGWVEVDVKKVGAYEKLPEKPQSTKGQQQATVSALQAGSKQ